MKIPSKEIFYQALIDSLEEEDFNVGCKSYPDAWFADMREEPKEWNHLREMAIDICNDCPLQTMCGLYAIEDTEVEGIWGGTTPADRMKIRAGRKKLPIQGTANHLERAIVLLSRSSIAHTH